MGPLGVAVDSEWTLLEYRPGRYVKITPAGEILGKATEMEVRAWFAAQRWLGEPLPQPEPPPAQPRAPAAASPPLPSTPARERRPSPVAAQPPLTPAVVAASSTPGGHGIASTLEAVEPRTKGSAEGEPRPAEPPAAVAVEQAVVPAAGEKKPSAPPVAEPAPEAALALELAESPVEAQAEFTDLAAWPLAEGAVREVPQPDIEEMQPAPENVEADLLPPSSAAPVLAAAPIPESTALPAEPRARDDLAASPEAELVLTEAPAPETEDMPPETEDMPPESEYQEMGWARTGPAPAPAEAGRPFPVHDATEDTGIPEAEPEASLLEAPASGDGSDHWLWFDPRPASGSDLTAAELSTFVVWAIGRFQSKPWTAGRTPGRLQVHPRLPPRGMEQVAESLGLALVTDPRVTPGTFRLGLAEGDGPPQP